METALARSLPAADIAPCRLHQAMRYAVLGGGKRVRPLLAFAAGEVAAAADARVEIVANMEAGQLPLEESLAAYKRGTDLLKFCQQKIQDAESQVRVLTEANQLENFPGDSGS